MSKDEFYVGYFDEAPPALGRFLWRVSFVLLLLATGLGALLVSRQAPFDPGTFEFGTVRSFEGIVRETPHPMLEVWGAEGLSSYFLVGFGKHGAASEIEGRGGHAIRLEGTLIHREGVEMIEVVSGSVAGIDAPELSGAADLAARVDLGEHVLEGEIVDSKCYLGVMKPGRGKPHRACAALCLRGGIPPILVLENELGDRRHVLLVGPDDRPLPPPELDLVALPVRVTGRLVRDGEGLRLLVSDIERRAFVG